MERPERPVIGFLTDFGLDGAAATCRGVILGICREAQIVDISHTVRKFAVRDGGYLLRSSLPYLPIGVHLGIVDPGVGTGRRPIAVQVGRGDILVGPDNGLLIPAADALGGIQAARVLENRVHWLPVTSSTFHGRDIFAPVTAHLAGRTAEFDDLGRELRITDLVRLEAPRARVADGALETVVTYVDSFGNLRMAGGRDELVSAIGEVEANAPVTVEFASVGGAEALRETARFATAFGQVEAGSSLLYVDSSGQLALADNQGNAALRIGVGTDRATRITRG